MRLRCVFYTLFFLLFASVLFAQSSDNHTKINDTLSGGGDLTSKGRQIPVQNRQIDYRTKLNFLFGAIAVATIVICLLIYARQQKTEAANKLLVAQKKELENINAAKDRIFSVISHDLRSPVNSLISFTDLLESGDIAPEDFSYYAGLLKKNLGYTAGLMDNLLNWARTQMNGYKLVRENFDITATIQQTIGLLEQDAAAKGVQILNEIDANTIVFADINMTALVVRNLLSNAIKYTKSGDRITVSTRTAPAKVSILVKDTGTGIAPEAVAELNSAGHAMPVLSKPGTDNEKGTGLGIMLCKNLVALMKGSVFLESELGKGSCFTVELPAYN